MLPISVLLVEAAENVSYDAKGKKDPFVSLVNKSSGLLGLAGVFSVDDIRLEGIVVDSEKGSIVVANGIVLKEGETRDGIKVVQIKESGVSFDIRGNIQFKSFSAESPVEANK